MHQKQPPAKAAFSSCAAAGFADAVLPGVGACPQAQ